MRKRIVLLLIAATVLLTAAGCGVYSFTGASISPEIKTISIDYFPNRAPMVQPTVSQVFTEKLRDKFVSQTNLTLVTEPGDLRFEGYISDYYSQPTAIQGNEQAALNRLTISVKVKYTNTRDEKMSFESSFSRYVDYDSQRSLNSVETQLIAEICDQLTDDIFNKAVINW
jgi:outer membrane lipopolysaccharide assembly protein LptE/RlpB